MTNSTTAQPTVTYPTATTAPPTTTTAPPTATTAQPPSGGEQEAVVLYISDMTEAKVREELTIIEKKKSRTKNIAHVFALLFTVLKVNFDCRKIKTNHGNHFSQSEQQNSMHSLHFE